MIHNEGSATGHSLKEMRSFRTPDGTRWGVDVQLPGASNAMVVFHHPDGRSARKDRYAWYDWHGAEASDVRANIPIAKIRQALTERDLTDLFQRSMPIGTGRPAFAPA